MVGSAWWFHSKTVSWGAGSSSFDSVTVSRTKVLLEGGIMDPQSVKW